MRDTPALDFIDELIRLGAKVKAYDPIVCDRSHQHQAGLKDFTLADNPEELAEDCDALVLVTDWQEFIVI
jgi:UDPglucose 6-dehydrogenase